MKFKFNIISSRIKTDWKQGDYFTQVVTDGNFDVGRTYEVREVMELTPDEHTQYNQIVYAFGVRNGTDSLRIRIATAEEITKYRKDHPF